MILPLLVVTTLAQGALAPETTPTGHGYWLQALPESLEEAALRDTMAQGAFAGPGPHATALARLSATYPGTVTSGLAHAAAGWLLADAGKNAEAIPHLSHPDVQKTAVVGYALLALGRTLEAENPTKAATAYEQASVTATGAVTCAALVRASEAWVKAGQAGKAAASLERAMADCPAQQATLLLRLAQVQDSRGETRAAAAFYDQLDRDWPASAQAREGALRLRALETVLPPLTAGERLTRDIRRGEALLEASRYEAAAAALRSALARRPQGDDLDLVRVRLGRALQGLGRAQAREAQAQLSAVSSASRHAAEAAYLLARASAQRGSDAAYETVVQRFPGTPWSGEALMALANSYQKDARDEDAVPYYRRLLQDNPQHPRLERAAWRVGWFDYRMQRYEDAATLLENVARSREQGSSTAGFLYWAGRARSALGQTERARALLDETVRRFKHSYHGLRAREALAQLPHRSAEARVVLPPIAPARREDIDQPARARIRELLLIGRLDEAREELRALPSSPVAQATLAFLEWQKGQLRPAIIAMKKAYPEYIGEAGDSLPADVWRILFPIGFQAELAQEATGRGLDPALVAALVCQESTFDPGAVSRVGARGLMQIMGYTGREIARDRGVRYRRAALHDPETSLAFGTYYFKQMLDRFGGRVERALAAYNAGPHRVDAWTAGRPEVSAEEFVESIPFTETRFYVMTILASREHYRRIYALGPPATSAAGASRP